MSTRHQWIFRVLVPTAFAAAAFGQTPAPSQSVITPIDGQERLKWLYVENLGLGSVLDDVAVGGVDTFFKTPKEYNTHWSGFGERIGVVTGNYGVKSVMEAGIGSIWGEDPRYVRTNGLSMKSRMAYVVKMTFLARDRSGNTMPAYSRYIAFPASSFLANAWEPTSQATANQAALRVALGFLSRMGENAWKEFIVRH